MSEVAFGAIGVTFVIALALAFTWRSDRRAFFFHVLPWLLLVAIGELIAGGVGVALGGAPGGWAGVALCTTAALAVLLRQLPGHFVLSRLIARFPEPDAVASAVELAKRERTDAAGGLALSVVGALMKHGLETEAVGVLGVPLGPSASAEMVAGDALWRGIIVYPDDLDEAATCFEQGRAILARGVPTAGTAVFTEAFELAERLVAVRRGRTDIDAPPFIHAQNEGLHVVLAAHVEASRGNEEAARSALARYGDIAGLFGLLRVARLGGPASDLSRALWIERGGVEPARYR